MERLELNGRRSGKMKVYCPLCRDRRKNKRDKSVSVNLDKGVAKCHYCGEVFFAKKKGLDTACFSNPCLSAQSVSKITQKHVDWFARERGISRETLERMGVTSKDEWICFNYYENGKVVNTKFRDLEKNFRMVSGGKIVPYNIDGIRGTPECIIVEGEIDDLSFAEIGRTDVISVPTGANTNLSWMDEFMESHFADKKVIYIAVDNDQKGLELQKALVARLGVERCRIVKYPEGCKDANEVLCLHYPTLQASLPGQTATTSPLRGTPPQEGGECDAGSEALHPSCDAVWEYGAEALKQCLEEAQEVPVEGVFTVKDVSRELRVLFEEGIQPGAETGWKDFDGFCTFELGRLCVVTGIPGSGKSEFTDELVMRLNMRHGWKAGFFSPENMPLTYHLRKLMEKVTGTPFEVGMTTEAEYCRAERYLQENFSFILPEEDFTVEHILEIARELVRKLGIKMLVVDPFNRFEHQVPPGQTETQYISAVLDRFTNFAMRNNCLVVLVAHPRKMNKVAGVLKEPVPTLYDINGSAAFFNKCDFGLVVDRDYEAKVTRIHIQKVKFKHLGQKGEAVFKYDARSGRYASYEEGPEAGQPGSPCGW